MKAKADMKTERIGDARLFGAGSPGGKGTGLIQLSQCRLPMTSRLATWILTTSFYEDFLRHAGALTDEGRGVLASILEELGDVPAGIRSSATNEASVSPEGTVSVRAGENTSFMLPNNHPDPAVRLAQMEKAVIHIYNDFLQKQPVDSAEGMAIVVNPIHGVLDDTLAGPVYYPCISGVANSYFPYALKTQNPEEGYARIAFGHGYATVLDDFPVISMVTVRNPLPLQLLSTGPGQQFFYALDMTKNEGLAGEELETMTRLHIRFASLRQINMLGVRNNFITIEELVQNDRFGFRTGLGALMEAISTRITSHFQIEFVFNIDPASRGEASGRFHVVQITQLPPVQRGLVHIPRQAGHTYLRTGNTQGHGIKRGVRFALVVSPFTYARDKHDQVRERIREINRMLGSQNESYVMVVPGRLGSRNRDWGIYVDYKDVDQAVAIFEYGVDIAGRPEPLPEEQGQTGGIYGSHFLYMIQGGHSEDQKRMQTRMYGTQGTHFLTNLMSNNIIYAYLAPLQDTIDPWFFSSPAGDDPIALLPFPTPVNIYADCANQRCVVAAESEP